MLIAQQILAVLVIAVSALLMLARVRPGMMQLPEALLALTPHAPQIMLAGALWYIAVRLVILFRYRR